LKKLSAVDFLVSLHSENESLVPVTAIKIYSDGRREKVVEHPELSEGLKMAEIVMAAKEAGAKVSFSLFNKELY